MSHRFDSPNSAHASPPFDVCLMLRSHAESRWLSHQMVPVLREIETREGLSEEQLGAALAYLEVMWIEACGRARETDAARVELDALGASEDVSLHEKALRYHAAVRRLRATIERRVEHLLSFPAETEQDLPNQRRGRILMDRP